MPSALRMLLVGLVAFGLGFAAATLLPSGSETGLEWERDGDVILLTPTLQDRGYLVSKPSQGLTFDGGEPVVPPGDVDEQYGTRELLASETFSVFEVKPLLSCASGLCQPCNVRPGDDCPISPPPPPPPPWEWLFHADLAPK